MVTPMQVSNPYLNDIREGKGKIKRIYLLSQIIFMNKYK